MCSHMLAGASAASSTIGGVVVDVETVVGASSGAAFAFEMTIASARRKGDKSVVLVGGSVSVSYTHLTLPTILRV